MNLTGTSTSNPTDVGGRPAYSVSISPKHDGGLLGSAQLAWDALKGVPLEVGIYARGNSTPVLDLKATNISYGAVSSSDIAVPVPPAPRWSRSRPPATPCLRSPPGANAKAGKGGQAAKARAKARKVPGVAAVARHVPFTLAAPASLVGLPRHGTSLLDWPASRRRWSRTARTWVEWSW